MGTMKLGVLDVIFKEDVTAWRSPAINFKLIEEDVVVRCHLKCLLGTGKLLGWRQDDERLMRSCWVRRLSRESYGAANGLGAWCRECCGELLGDKHGAKSTLREQKGLWSRYREEADNVMEELLIILGIYYTGIMVPRL
ncbi:hypothetical protein SK128_006461 [Halocaridina rubra]|uniref:Uncharacterized protein n=1 Tax=Halocaridina rubra TaxID=373956 RepID=A0AAN8WRN1_HALRR